MHNEVSPVWGCQLRTSSLLVCWMDDYTTCNTQLLRKTLQMDSFKFPWQLSLGAQKIIWLTCHLANMGKSLNHRCLCDSSAQTFTHGLFDSIWARFCLAQIALICRFVWWCRWTTLLWNMYKPVVKWTVYARTKAGACSTRLLQEMHHLSICFSSRWCGDSST